MLRRTFALSVASAALALGLSSTAFAQAAAAPLALKVYSNPDPRSFGVASTLITGKTEAVLLDAQFTLSDAHRVVADVLASGKKLTTVLITCGDPDFYFGLEVIQKAFPAARIVASQAVIDHIQQTKQKKLDTWGPQLGANGPTTVVVPQPLTANNLTVDGERLDVKGLDSADAESVFVWIPAIKAVAGGVAVFGNFHLWTADSATPALRAAWLKLLDRIDALKPDTVVPGHLKAGTSYTADNVRYTREYLQAFETELARTKDSSELIAAMKTRYPNAGLDVALTIGAKVNKGEMKW